MCHVVFVRMVILRTLGHCSRRLAFPCPATHHLHARPLRPPPAVTLHTLSVPYFVSLQPHSSTASLIHRLAHALEEAICARSGKGTRRGSQENEMEVHEASCTRNCRLSLGVPCRPAATVRPSGAIVPPSQPLSPLSRTQPSCCHCVPSSARCGSTCGCTRDEP
ncbi:hypothetical protein DENSPDRAFT_89770 [Dentipellis sp. KUC8613]|nr:hypothetical protein DENSPDRAFT_89770 [Dentipellis sp. KUC8613]